MLGRRWLGSIGHDSGKHETIPGKTKIFRGKHCQAKYLVCAAFLFSFHEN